MTERKVSWEAYSLDSDFRKTERDKFIDNLDEDDPEEEDIADELRNMQTIISTPFGDFIKEDVHNPMQNMECQMLHTNFDITEREFIIANFVEGVKAIAPVSRYELLVGFGKMFSVAEVKRDLEQKILHSDEYPEQLFQIQRDTLMMDSQ